MSLRDFYDRMQRKAEEAKLDRVLRQIALENRFVKIAKQCIEQGESFSDLLSKHTEYRENVDAWLEKYHIFEAAFAAAKENEQEGE